MRTQIWEPVQQHFQSVFNYIRSFKHTSRYLNFWFLHNPKWADYSSSWISVTIRWNIIDLTLQNLIQNFTLEPDVVSSVCLCKGSSCSCIYTSGWEIPTQKRNSLIPDQWWRWQWTTLHMKGNLMNDQNKWITTSFPPGSPFLLSLINLAVLKTTIHSVQNPCCNLMIVWSH